MNEEQLFYFQSRGISKEDAVNMIVNGFCKEVIRELALGICCRSAEAADTKIRKFCGLISRRFNEIKMLEIKNLDASIDGKSILKGVNLTVKPAKSMPSWARTAQGSRLWPKVLAGHPAYEVTEGEMWFKGQNLLEMEPEERAHVGLFMSFQYPVEIPGVSNIQFLRTAYNAKRKAQRPSRNFAKRFRKAAG